MDELERGARDKRDAAFFPSHGQRLGVVSFRSYVQLGQVAHKSRVVDQRKGLGAFHAVVAILDGPSDPQQPVGHGICRNKRHTRRRKFIKVVGSQFIGSQFIGSQFIGSQFIGSQFIGSRFIGTSFFTGNKSVIIENATNQRRRKWAFIEQPDVGLCKKFSSR